MSCSTLLTFHHLCGHTKLLSNHTPSCQQVNSLNPFCPSTASTLECLDRYCSVCVIREEYDAFGWPVSGMLFQSDPNLEILPGEIIAARLDWFTRELDRLRWQNPPRPLIQQSPTPPPPTHTEASRLPDSQKFWIFDPSGTVSTSLLQPTLMQDSAENEEKECSICHDEIEEGEIREGRRLPCGHEYDKECIVEWFELGWGEKTEDGSWDGNASCPVCRRKYRLMAVPSFEDEDEEWDGMCYEYDV